MDIRDTRSLKGFAGDRLEEARDQKKIVLIYSGLIIGLAVLVTLINHLLNLRMEQAGGLSNLGTRTVLSALQTMIPMLHTLAVLCLDLGYIAAMLRVARGQFVSPRTLKLGVDRFLPLLRCHLLLMLIYLAMGTALVYLASLLFVFSPWAKPFMDLMAPLIAQASELDPQIVLEESLYLEILSSMVPMLGILAVLFCVFGLPIIYRYRMVNYVIIDNPALGSMAVLRKSRQMMRGNFRKLLKLDFSFWWYYLAMGAVMLIGEGNQLLSLFGVELPMGEGAAFVLFYSVYLALTFAVYYFLRNRLEVTYSLVYDALKPQEPKQEGVVLGNIFQM